uniref:Uncharacterized protein n=1 Tax=Rhizophora mucronata TaxID=61149 RepID=A0A2P2MS53_RHIMU
MKGKPRNSYKKVALLCRRQIPLDCYSVYCASQANYKELPLLDNTSKYESKKN